MKTNQTIQNREIDPSAMNRALLAELQAHFMRLQIETHYSRGDHPIQEMVDQMSYEEVKTQLKKKIRA